MTQKAKEKGLPLSKKSQERGGKDKEKKSVKALREEVSAKTRFQRKG